MSVTHTTTLRDDVCNYVVDKLDVGGPGKMKFRLAGSANSPGAAAATLTLSATAFGASSSGTATASAITSDTNAAGNASPVAAATLETAGGTVIVHCAVAASGSDVDLSGGLTINAGDTVECSSLTYTAMP